MNVQDFEKQIDAIVALAISEDISDPLGKIPTGDHAVRACFPQAKMAKAKLLVKSDGVLAGVALAEKICNIIDSSLQLEILLRDGATVRVGDVAFYITGSARSILQAERLILNFMQRMSGIATNTARYVAEVAGTQVRVLDTRKTTPALRAFEKWAVQIGGGHNHRFGLYDMIMLKDNHVDFCGGISKAILAAKKYQEENNLQLRVEIETRNLTEVAEALTTGHIHRIMFDNFSPAMVREGVALVQKKYEVEVSGGITLNTIRSYAEAGPDFISVGALTHSSGSLDLSLKAVKM